MKTSYTERLYLRKTVLPAQDGVRLDRFLRQWGIPGSFVSHCKFIENGLQINDRPARTDAVLQVGDCVSLRIDDVGQTNRAHPMDCGVQIVWEDEYLAVFRKPAGLAVHGSERLNIPTVASFAAFCWGAGTAFHPVNRLDRGTSGLMLVARCGFIHDCLRRQLHSPELRREYLAICDGVPAIRRGIWNDPIGEDPSRKNCRILRADGKTAVTAYEVLSENGCQSLLRLRLETGRCHQIRVHCAAHGLPLCGDVVYGGSELLSRPALHSAELRFLHPVTGETLCFTDPLPADMHTLAEHLCVSRYLSP